MDVWKVLTITSVVIASIEFCLTIITLSKVSSVNKAQKEARKFTQDLLNIDRLEVDLVRVIDKFRSFKDVDTSVLVSELSLQLGMIKGVRRALDESADDSCRNVIESGKGFFGESFVKDNIKNAKSNIDIITGRTKLVAGFYILDSLRQACERGVEVRIIGLSPDAPEAILEDATKTVTNPPPKDAADYKRQIEDNMREILDGVSTWGSEAQSNFRYKVSKSVPRVAILRSDNIVNFGFLQFYREAQPVELEEREYLKLPLSSPSGKIAVKHIDLVWADSDFVFPVPKQQDDENKGGE